MSLEYDITRIMVEAATLDDHGDGLVTLRIDTKAAGRILALLRERLLAPGAVEAAGYAVAYTDPNSSIYKGENDEAEYDPQGRAAIVAALDHAEKTR